MAKKILAALSSLVAGSAAAAMLEAGMPFPSWTLVDHTGTNISSADLAGTAYLLWYYPKAMTPG